MIPMTVLLRWTLGATVTVTASVILPGQTLEERLRQLEARVESLAAENSELRTRLGVGPVAATVVMPAGKETRLSVGGFLQGQAEFGGVGDPRFAGLNDRFFFRRARIYLAGSFENYLEFKAELDLQGNSLSGGTGLLARANEIYVGWNRYPAATLRFGQLKPAFGAEQLASDTAMLTIERSLASDRLTDGRQLAVGLYGSVAAGRLGYLAVVGNGNGSNVSANDNDHFLHSTRVFGVALDDPHAGRLVLGAGVFRTVDAGVRRAGLRLDSVPGGAEDGLLFGPRQGWAVDATWSRDRLVLSGEYLEVEHRPDNGVPARSFTASGWQASAGWFLVPETLQAIVRREAFDPDSGHPGDDSRGWTVGLNYFVKRDVLKLQLNYLLGDHPGLPDDRGRWISRVQVVY